MRLLLVTAALLALAGCHPNPQQQPAANEAAASPETGQGKGVDRTHSGKPAPATEFTDPAGKPVNLASFRGKPLLVNLWATWCAPCVKELPTLDRLSGKGGIRVLAISQDSAPHASVVAFLKTHQIATLEPYQDTKMGLSGALGAEVLPTSILLDAQGKEVWRYVGDLDWMSPEAAKLLGEADAGGKSS